MPIQAAGDGLDGVRKVFCPGMDRNCDNPDRTGHCMKEQAEDYITRGVDQFRHRRYSEALAMFDRAVSLDPGCTRAWNGRAAALGNLGLFPAALDSCDTAIATDPVTSGRGVTAGGCSGILAAMPKPLTPATGLSLSAGFCRGMAHPGVGAHEPWPGPGSP